MLNTNVQSQFKTENEKSFFFLFFILLFWLNPFARNPFHSLLPFCSSNFEIFSFSLHRKHLFVLSALFIWLIKNCANEKKRSTKKKKKKRLVLILFHFVYVTFHRRAQPKCKETSRERSKNGRQYGLNERIRFAVALDEKLSDWYENLFLFLFFLFFHFSFRAFGWKCLEETWLKGKRTWENK